MSTSRMHLKQNSLAYLQIPLCQQMFNFSCGDTAFYRVNKTKNHKVILDFLFSLLLSPLTLSPSPSYSPLSLPVPHSHTHTHTPFSCLLPCLYFLMTRALFFFFILFSHPSFSGLSCPSKYDLPEDEDHILVIFAFPASGVASSTLEILSGVWGKVQSVCGFASPDSRTKVMSVSNNGAFSKSCIYVEVLFCYCFKLG